MVIYARRNRTAVLETDEVSRQRLFSLSPGAVASALHPLHRSQAHLWQISCFTNPLIILPPGREMYPVP